MTKAIDQNEISLGQILQKKRQDLKIEIAEIVAHLKIKQRDIEAIENDDLARVTKHLYIPGLIKSYGKFLKIDEKLITEKVKFLQFESNVKNKKHQLINIGENLDLTPNKESLFNVLLLSILFFLLLLSFYNSSEKKTDILTDKNLIFDLEKISDERN